VTKTLSLKYILDRKGRLQGKADEGKTLRNFLAIA
jgi:hypothetical protein